MKHRREIDGLRALAILPVLLFHAGFSWMPGGFFGVDIFFVISGFLITGIIVNELHRDGKFSIIGFYERRARRIMPALFLVIIVMYPVGWFLLFPNEWSNFCQSLVSIIYFASNYFFLSKTGYFDPNIDLNPMLHTWSLAIEEQFYLFFPLILWLLWKVVKERYWIPILTVVGIGSLFWAQFNWSYDPNGNFYLLQFRAWELIAGALAAIHLNHRDKGAYSNQWMSGLGLIGILISVFAIGSDLPHPGFITLVPVLSTVLVILAAGPGTLVNRILSWRALVGVGLISYSAYLWHQPIFAFYRTAQLHDPQPADFLPLIALVLLLSWASWKFVENPFRDRKKFGRKQIFIGTAVLAILVVGVGLFGRSTWADNHRTSIAGKNFDSMQERTKPNRGLSASCTKYYEAEPKCTNGSEPSLLLWGDSYAMQWALAIKNSPTQVGFVQQTLSACGPVLGMAPSNSTYGIEFGKRCIAQNDSVFDWVKRHPNIKYVVLGSNWQNLLADNAKAYQRDGTISLIGDKAWQAVRETVTELKALGVKVVLMLPTPTNLEDHGACSLRAIANDTDPAACNFALSSNYRADFAKQLESYGFGAPVVSVDDLLCPEGTCLAVRDGNVIYRDPSHISSEGSKFIGETYDLAKILIEAADRGN